MTECCHTCESRDPFYVLTFLLYVIPDYDLGSILSLIFSFALHPRHHIEIFKELLAQESLQSLVNIFSVTSIDNENRNNVILNLVNNSILALF